MKRIVGAYHIAMMNHWRDVVGEQEERIFRSGLLSATDHILVGVVGGTLGPGDFRRDLACKATIVCSPNLQEYEFPTLRMLQNHARKRDFKAWYIHTKGVSRPPNQQATNWRRLMEYFVIDQFRICVKELDSCDACGVSLNTQYRVVRFFAGNFWWANSGHLSQLPRINDLSLLDRFQAEHWIGWNAAKLRDLADGRSIKILSNGAIWDGKDMIGLRQKEGDLR